jgi:DNA polymerase I-like protein with 3'-5' exonuclease and polymerase domains
MSYANWFDAAGYFKEPALAVDTETTGLHPRKGHEPFVVTAFDNKGKSWGWEFDVDPYTRKVDYTSPKSVKQIEKMRLVFLKYTNLVFHNMRFDVRMLLCIPGLDFATIFANTIHFDTLPLSHVYDSSGTHELKPLARRHLDMDSDDQQILQKKVVEYRRRGKKDDLNLAEDVEADYWLPSYYGEHGPVMTYGILDAKRTMGIFLVLGRLVFKEGLWPQFQREMELSHRLFKIEDAGLHMRKRPSMVLERGARLAEQKHHKYVVEYAAKYGIKDYNPSSGPQTQNLLYNKLKFPVLFLTKKGKSPSCDKKAMDFYRGPFIELHPEYAKHFEFLDSKSKVSLSGKVLSTLKGYHDKKVVTTDERGNLLWYLYPSLLGNGTQTTRLSSREPNGQNISNGREVFDQDGNLVEILYNMKELFGPPPGRVWYSYDYSQLQLRIFAYISKEQSLIDAFARGEDFHDYVCQQLFSIGPKEATKAQRRIAKAINFGIIFGAGKRKIEMEAGITGIYDEWRSRFPSVDRYMQEAQAFARKHKCIYTPGGYRLTIDSDKPYKAVNYAVQGCEGDIVKNAINTTDNFLQQWNESNIYAYKSMRSFHPCRVLFTVHDEILFEADERVNFPWLDIQSLMESEGEKYGMVTPAECTRHDVSWAKGTKLKPTITSSTLKLA